MDLKGLCVFWGRDWHLVLCFKFFDNSSHLRQSFYLTYKVLNFKWIFPHPGINLYHIDINSILCTHRTDSKLLELWYISWHCFCMKLTHIGWLDELSIKKKRKAAPFTLFQDTKFILGCKSHTIHFLISNYSNK